METYTITGLGKGEDAPKEEKVSRRGFLKWAIAAGVGAAAIAGGVATFLARPPPPTTPAPTPPAPTTPTPTTQLTTLSEDELYKKAKEEGKLVVYHARETETIEVLFTDFKKRYPGIETEQVRAGGLVIGQRYYAEWEKGVYVADTIHSGVAEFFPDFRRRGMIAKLDDLPNWNSIIELAKDSNKHYVSFDFVTMPIIYNTNLLKDEEVPTDLWEYTKPEWKDRTATADPKTAGVAVAWYSFASEARSKDPRSPHSPPGLGWKFIEAIKNNGVLLAGQLGALTETIATGRRAVALHQADNSYFLAKQKAAPIGFKYAKQGATAQHTNIGVNTKAPHPNAARLFVNWLLSVEGQQVVVNKTGGNPIREDVKPLPDRFPVKDTWVLDIEKITSAESEAFLKDLFTRLGG